MRRYEVFRVGLKIAPVGELFFTRRCPYKGHR